MKLGPTLSGAPLSIKNEATQAMALLNAAGIDFEVHKYEPDPTSTSRGLDAAHALAVDAATVFKTLVLNAGDKLVVAVIAADRSLDLRALASAAGVKRARLAEREIAERSTGYLVGGISPIGQRKTLATFVDLSAQEYAQIFVNGGRRGVMIKLSPTDLLAMTKGVYADLVRDNDA